MGNGVLLGTAVVVALAMAPAPAFSQAAAESVLLNGASSTSAVKAGSALNSALNGAGKRLAGRIQQVPQASPSETRREMQKVQGKNAAGASLVGSGSTSQQGSMIASVQGVAGTCAPTNGNPQSSDNKPKTESGPTNCPGGSAKPAPQDKYKSVITLSFPK